MTPSQFEGIWTSKYPLTPPIAYLLRDAYPERWFRIHSLPESKRYPEDESDWSILLDRQNSLISDLLGNNSDVLLVAGEYDFDSNNGHVWEFSPVDSIHHLPFTELKPVPLETLNTERNLNEFKPGEFYRLVFSTIHWQSSTWDKLLKEIAYDELRAFFISIANELIIAPYDGGIDIILKDEPTRNIYKTKYKDWLSIHESGL